MPVELNERQLRLALENVPVPMLAHDETGRVRYISKELLRLTGYTAEQIPTLRAWLDLAYDDPEIGQRMLDAHRAAMATSRSAAPRRRIRDARRRRLEAACGNSAPSRSAATTTGRADQRHAWRST